MPHSIKAWICRRKFYRLCLQGEKIVKELKDWGCDDLTCNNCPALDKYHNCGVYSSITKYRKKLDKVISKYGVYLDLAGDMVVVDSKMGVDSDG